MSGMSTVTTFRVNHFSLPHALTKFLRAERGEEVDSSLFSYIERAGRDTSRVVNEEDNVSLRLTDKL